MLHGPAHLRCARCPQRRPSAAAAVPRALESDPDQPAPHSCGYVNARTHPCVDVARRPAVLCTMARSIQRLQKSGYIGGATLHCNDLTTPFRGRATQRRPCAGFLETDMSEF